eukprot:TRINITY_DN760_c2_g5_i1.p1 TRINITY_DN760_c2_g5~~TRINITY_DN760_c2_g5_i1.p1  ORF type:complete len:1316 (-),score=509.04 TRINITY_DN760_c2_g5_i1:3474-7421(-)
MNQASIEECKWRRAPAAPPLGATCLLRQFDVLEFNRLVRHHVDTLEVLVASVEQLFGHQEGPRGVLPDFLLGVLVQGFLVLAFGQGQGLGDVGIDLVVLVVGGVVQTRREGFRRQQRTQCPVGFAGGRRPADVEQTHRRGGRVLPAFHTFHALAGFQGLDLGLDADLRQLLLQELDDLYGGAMGVGRPQFGFETVGVAGFGQQGLGLLHVIRPGAGLEGVVHALRHHTFHRGGITVEGNLDQCLLVDGVVDGLAHLRVIEGLLLGVHRHVTLDDGRRSHHIQVGLALQQIGLLVGQRIGELRLAGLHHGRAGVVVDHRLPDDLVNLGVARLPVTIEFLDLDVVGLLPLDELEGTCADRVEGNVLVAVLLQRSRRNHHRRRVGQHVDEGRERLLQDDLDGVVVQDFGLGDTVEEVVALQLVVRVGDAVEHGLDGIGLEHGTVLELHALLEADGVLQAILADQVAFSQHRNELHVLVETEQALVEGLGHGQRERVVGVVGVQRGEGGIHRQRHGLGREGVRCGELQRGTQGGDSQPFGGRHSLLSCCCRHVVSPDQQSEVGTTQWFYCADCIFYNMKTGRRSERAGNTVLGYKVPGSNFLQGFYLGLIAHQPDRAGDLVGQQLLAMLAQRRVGNGDGRHQLARIGMLRVLEDGAARADLDDLAQVHHRHAVADALHHGHVVRDEDEGDPQLGLQVQHQVDDLGLDRHVQRRHRFIGDDDLGIQGQGTCDADALALAAGEFVRIALAVLGREAHAGQQCIHARLCALLHAMYQHRLHDGIADRHARIERGKRILEDELDIATQLAQLAARQLRQVAPAEFDTATGDIDQAQQGTAGGGLAAAGLADDGQGLAGIQIEADLLHRMHALLHTTEDAALDIKAGGQLAHLEDGLALLGDFLLCLQVGRAGGQVGTHLGLRGDAKAQRRIGAAHGTQARHGGQQGTGIGMGRRGKECLDLVLFHLLAAAHHHHAVGHLGHHAHVVGDEDHAHLHLFLQGADQLQDLRLDGHVQGRGRFIGNQQRGLAGQRHGDHHALAHATRQLVRMAAQHALGFGDAHHLQHAQRLGLGGRTAHALVQADRFGDLLADGKDRVQRGHRLLEDHGDLLATDAAHGGVIGLGQVQGLAVAAQELHAAAGDLAAAVFDQAHDGQRRHRLARARLADDGQGLALADVEGQVAHRVHRPFGGGEAHAQVVHVQYALWLLHLDSLLRAGSGLVCVVCVNGRDRRLFTATVAAIHAFGVEGQHQVALGVHGNDATAPADLGQRLEHHRLAGLLQRLAGIGHARADVVAGHRAQEGFAGASGRYRHGSVVGIAAGTDHG